MCPLGISIVQAVRNLNVAERDLALAVMEEADLSRVGVPRTATISLCHMKMFRRTYRAQVDSAKRELA